MEHMPCVDIKKHHDAVITGICRLMIMTVHVHDYTLVRDP